MNLIAKLMFVLPALLAVSALAIEMPRHLGAYMGAGEAVAVVAIPLALALAQLVALVRE